MLGNDVEIDLIFRRILGPLVLGWAPNHFVLGAQDAPGEKRLVCIPDNNIDLDFGREKNLKANFKLLTFGMIGNFVCCFVLCRLFSKKSFRNTIRVSTPTSPPPSSHPLTSPHCTGYECLTSSGSLHPNQ